MDKTFELTGYNVSYLIPIIGLVGAGAMFFAAHKMGKSKVLFTGLGLASGLVAGALIKKPTKVLKVK